MISILPLPPFAPLKKCYINSFQVLINGLQHFVPVNVKPKLQMVETFIKVRISMSTISLKHVKILEEKCLVVMFEPRGFLGQPTFLGLLDTCFTWKCLVNIFSTKIINRNFSFSQPTQAYYLPETEYVHWARAHPVRKLWTGLFLTYFHLFQSIS